MGPMPRPSFLLHWGTQYKGKTVCLHETSQHLHQIFIIGLAHNPLTCAIVSNIQLVCIVTVQEQWNVACK